MSPRCSRKVLILTVAMLMTHARNLVADTGEVSILIKDHLFFPDILEIPAGQKTRLNIRNDDATPEEFESYELNREKIIPGNSRTVIFIGPLKPGEYPFFGEFYPTTATGKVMVK